MAALGLRNLGYLGIGSWLLRDGCDQPLIHLRKMRQEGRITSCGEHRPVSIEYAVTTFDSPTGEGRIGELIASRYETTCPNQDCNRLMFLHEVPRFGRQIICPYCQVVLEVTLPEHAYA